MEIVSRSLDKVFNNVVRAMPLPKVVEEGVIGLKEILKNEEARERIGDLFNNLFNGNEFKGQEKMLNNINNKYQEWENLIDQNKLELAKKLSSEIKEDCKGLKPTIELIQKINNIDNTIDLYNSKQIDKSNGLTELEKDILQKIA